jgi:sugar lactone lactonase YvrE
MPKLLLRAALEIFGFAGAFLVFAGNGHEHRLTEFYQNNDFQLTGVSVSQSGRFFVNFPYWSDHYLNAVIEVMPDGTTRPYPDEEWNRWDRKAASAHNHFVCVQAVVADNDSLWVVDAAAPMLIVDVPGGPKLVQIDLSTDKVKRIIPFGPDVAKTGSYMNDVRIDDKRQTAYLTDSGIGGIVVVDLKTGKSHRALDGNASVLPEPGVQIVIDGKTLLQNGKPPQFNSDSLALSPDGEYVYYKPITSKTLYRIKTELLRNANTPAAVLSAGVQKVAEIFPTDGFWMDSKGDLYLSDLTHNAVAVRKPDGSIQRVVSDPRLQWPDTFSEGPDGAIYISASHINDSPTFNQGKSTRTQPYEVFKFQP